MATFYFDSSGLVKRYVQETGSAWVQTLCDPSAGHGRVIGQITGPEMIAAITRRMRRGDLTPSDAAAVTAQIEIDFTSHHLRLEVTADRIQEAMRLAKTYGLRGYDAVQLALALFLCVQCRVLGLPDPILVTADTELAAAAAAESLIVENPNLHP